MSRITRPLICSFLLTLALAAVPALGLGNCPDGEWAPDEGICVLCLPGWEPAATGNTTPAPNNYPCFTCKRVNNGGGTGGGDGSVSPDAAMCVRPLEPIKPLGIGVVQIGDKIEFEELGSQQLVAEAGETRES